MRKMQFPLISRGIKRSKRDFMRVDVLTFGIGKISGDSLVGFNLVLMFVLSYFL